METACFLTPFKSKYSYFLKNLSHLHASTLFRAYKSESYLSHYHVHFLDEDIRRWSRIIKWNGRKFHCFLTTRKDHLN
jgi:hypothetical protein